jgi:hypothetical protein
MDVDISYQLGYVHGIRGMGMAYQWINKDYVRGYAKGMQMKRMCLQQEEDYVKRSGHQGLRQTASATTVLSEA